MFDLRKNFFRVGGYTQSCKWLLARGMISLSKAQLPSMTAFSDALLSKSVGICAVRTMTWTNSSKHRNRPRNGF